MLLRQHIPVCYKRKIIYKQQFDNELTLQVKSMNIKEGLYFIKIQNNTGVKVDRIIIK